MCTNEWSPADGRVVHLKFGCGAHSETGQQDEDREISRSSGVILDELDVEYQKDAAAADEPAEQKASDEPAEQKASDQSTEQRVSDEPAEGTNADAAPAGESAEAPGAAEEQSEEPAPILVEPSGAEPAAAEPAAAETVEPPAQGSLLDEIPEADSPADEAPAADGSSEA